MQLSESVVRQSALSARPRVLSVRTESLPAGAILIVRHRKAVHGPTWKPVPPQEQLILARMKTVAGSAAVRANPLHIHEANIRFVSQRAAKVSRTLPSY